MSQQRHSRTGMGPTHAACDHIVTPCFTVRVRVKVSDTGGEGDTHPTRAAPCS